MCREDHDGDADEHSDQPPSHVGVPNRKPMPRTASIHRGSPSFLRIAATCASTVLVGPNQLTSHTFSRCRCACTPPGIEREVLEEIELLGRERDFLPAKADPPGAPIDLQDADHLGDARLDTTRRRGRRCRATGDSADAGHELAEAERLGHVVVRAQLQTENAVELVAAARSA